MDVLRVNEVRWVKSELSLTPHGLNTFQPCAESPEEDLFVKSTPSAA